MHAPGDPITPPGPSPCSPSTAHTHRLSDRTAPPAHTRALGLVSCSWYAVCKIYRNCCVDDAAFLVGQLELHRHCVHELCKNVRIICNVGNCHVGTVLTWLHCMSVHQSMHVYNIKHSILLCKFNTHHARVPAVKAPAPPLWQ